MALARSNNFFSRIPIDRCSQTFSFVKTRMLRRSRIFGLVRFTMKRNAPSAHQILLDIAIVVAVSAVVGRKFSIHPKQLDVGRSSPISGQSSVDSLR